ncbi:MAG: hypothetical protein JW990_17145 [Thermoleophilia bacterium]|nr:hypothetical protein [Thermoleophilia bacterium]
MSIESRSRVRRWMLAVAAALILGFAVLGIIWIVPFASGVALADDGVSSQTGGQKVAVFEDVTIGPDQTWNNVVVVGGDVVVEGAVAESVVVVGGDVTLRSGARVGYDRWDDGDDAAIVSVFGDVLVESGAAVSGRVVDVAGGAGEALTTAFVDPVAKPWKWTSIVSWIVSTIFAVVAAVIVVAIAPQKVAAVRDRARHHFFSSLGWGALGLIIGVPLVTILLIITVIGLLVVIPWLAIVVPIVLLFGYVAVAAMLGRLILGEREDRRSQIMVAAVLGVVIFSVIRWIPYAGAIILAVVVFVGLGAVITGIWAGNRRPPKEEPAVPIQTGSLEWQQTPPPAQGPSDWQRPAGGEPPLLGGPGGQEPPAD